MKAPLYPAFRPHPFAATWAVVYAGTGQNRRVIKYLPLYHLYHPADLTDQTRRAMVRHNERGKP